MVFLRFLALALLTLFSFGMGTIPANEANGVAKVFSVLFFVFAPALYFLPTIEAKLQSSSNLVPIALTNTFLGWTLVGWVAAIVWAHSKPSSSATTVSSAAAQAVAPAETKTCPMCAETVLAAAIKCKHCGSAC